MPAQADINFESELWEAAVALRGTVAPADYKHYVLPLLFLRYLSLRYEQRYEQLALALKDRSSAYYTGDPEVDAEVLDDPAEYESRNGKTDYWLPPATTCCRGYGRAKSA